MHKGEHMGTSAYEHAGRTDGHQAAVEHKEFNPSSGYTNRYEYDHPDTHTSANWYAYSCAYDSAYALAYGDAGRADGHWDAVKYAQRTPLLSYALRYRQAAEPDAKWDNYRVAYHAAYYKAIADKSRHRVHADERAPDYEADGHADGERDARVHYAYDPSRAIGKRYARAVCYAYWHKYLTGYGLGYYGVLDADREAVIYTEYDAEAYAQAYK